MVTSDVTLGGMLDVSLISPFTLSPGQSFEIIDVGVSSSGTFSDLAEGGLVGKFSGTNLLITYFGGDGNDVTLLAARPGDFDFLKWQRGDLSNPPSQSDLDDWLATFGNIASPITTASITVPEPSTGIMLILVIESLWPGRRRHGIGATGQPT